MKKALGLFFIFLSTVALAKDGQRVGEIQHYKLGDSSRTSWVISGGNVSLSFTDYKVDAKLGPAYTLRVDYLFNIRLYGTEKGSFNLLVPEKVLTADFQKELIASHPQDLQSFKLDYRGMGNVANYGPSPIFVLYGLNNAFMPGSEKGPKPPLDEIYLRLNPQALVFGAVQIDLKGTFMGFSFSAGFDLVK